MISEVPTQKKITQSGDSLVINVTKECKALAVKRGDYVNVIITIPHDGQDD